MRHKHYVFHAAMFERKKAAHRLYVDESVNDDNSVVALNPKTMETLQFFRGDTVLLKARCSSIHTGRQYEAALPKQRIHMC
jgi:hypothetical protein